MIRSGLDFIANTTTENEQSRAVATALADGRFLLAWTSLDPEAPSGSKLRARLLDSSGDPVGDDFIVNSTAEASFGKAVSALPDGGFVVTWEAGNGSTDGSAQDVRARIFDSDGVALSGDFLVHASAAEAQHSPSVSVLSDGNVLFAWTSSPGEADISPTEILVHARLFSAEGVALGDEFAVDSSGPTPQGFAATAALADERFIVTWSSGDGDETDANIRARLFDGDGAPVADAFVVNSTLNGAQTLPAVAVLSSGRFLVTWESDDDGDGSGSLIRGRLFEATGTAVGDDFVINSTTLNQQHSPQITALPDGRFIVTWYSTDDGDGSESVIRARLFSADGTAVGADFIVNTTTEGHQTYPSVATNEDGDVVVTWSSSDPGDGSSLLVRAVVLDSTAAASAPTITSNGGGDTATVTIDENETAVTTVVATDPDLEDGDLTYAIVGGADQAKFQIDAATGVLSFIAAPDFEAPTDAGADNSYVVEVRVSDNGDPALTDVQTITVDVADIAPVIPGDETDNSLIGTPENDFIRGFAGNDTLDGRGGGDTLEGGLGDDRFIVRDAGDAIVELPGEGNDWVYAAVSYVLSVGAHVERLSTNNQVGTVAIDLTGNDLGQHIIGNDGANVLVGGGGDDRLTGRAGADVLDGGDGVDTANYVSLTAAVVVVLNGASDAVVLIGGVDEDTVRNIENVIGGEGDDVLTGDAQANTLDGGIGGDDTLAGGFGDDRFLVRSADDIVIELDGQGDDWVYAAISYSLTAGAHVENLSTTSLVGTAGINLTGNELAQVIWGNDGANVLNGGGGNDTLRGRGGADTFLFSTAPNAADNLVTILDYVAADDIIHLDNAVFTGLAAGALTAAAFLASAGATAATDDAHRIVYNTTTGALYFDADGVGGDAAVQFALLTGAPTITSAEFVVV